ncbi:ectonucleotide pyrophosphatase/phosphodiesterase, partial [Roseisolibacter sp. H3M3-2]|uniref:alkaline phosphatase family protein n=1 Tax=Roseisolibacter sp. H3M3-2 TaxID=3031323 RepID=UPI0023DC409A
AGPAGASSSSAAGAAAADTAGPIVVLLSFDGFGRSYLDRGLPLPNLARLAARGVRARALRPSFPSLTFPNHYTLVTGKLPGHSGLVLNKFWDPALRAPYVHKDSVAPTEARWYRAEPLWTTAERQGVRAAAYFWPGSAAPAPDGARPTLSMHPYDDRVSAEAKVDSVAAWLRRPAATRPRFVAVYVPTVDQVGHRSGPTSAALDSAVVHADRAVGRLLDSVAASPVGARVNVVVLSDHGMLPIAADPVVALSRFADMAGVRAVDNGPYMALWFDGDAARRDAVLAALRRGFADAKAPARAWRREETPAAWALRDEPRAGDVVVLADPGYFVTVQPAPAGYRFSPGDHGWDPDAATGLDGIFLAAGPNVRPLGELPTLRNVHVYPFLARLLGVRALPGDGDDAVLRGAVAGAAAR